jgi:hypothetical protein
MASGDRFEQDGNQSACVLFSTTKFKNSQRESQLSFSVG